MLITCEGKSCFGELEGVTANDNFAGNFHSDFDVECSAAMVFIVPIEAQVPEEGCGVAETELETWW